MSTILQAVYHELALANSRLRAEIERLRADMDQRMTAYVEAQERDEAEIARLKADLAEADGLISTHQHKLDNTPRSNWPKGSILEKAIARHEARALADREGK